MIMKYLAGLRYLGSRTESNEIEGESNDENDRTRGINPRTSSRNVVSRSRVPLLASTWERDWPNVVKRCQSHPHEATYITEGSRRTALHLACFNHGAPIYVVEAILSANPYAILLEDSQGYTPLHVACSFRGGDYLVPIFCTTIEKLAMELGKDSSTFSTETSSPLELACRRDAPISTLQALLFLKQVGIAWVAPVTGGEPYWKELLDHRSHQSPLQTLLNNSLKTTTSSGRSDKRLKDIVKSIYTREDIEIFEKFNKLSPKEELWAKCVLLIREAVEEDIPFLHALVSVATPVISLVINMGPFFADQALQRDHYGYVPLHHAILHPYEGGKLIKIVRSINCTAASTSLSNGTLPLIKALEVGRTWMTGVAYLAYADPELLPSFEHSMRLYPFMIAAMYNADLDTIYNLLCCTPQLIQQSILLH